MQLLALVREDVALGAPALWAALRDFANPQRLAPSIARCEVDGEGVGAVRIVHSSRGRVIHERLLQRDDDRMCLQYEVTDGGAMPLDEITRYRSTVTLTPAGRRKTCVEWMAEGEVTGAIEPVTVWCEALYRGAIANLAASNVEAG